MPFFLIKCLLTFQSSIFLFQAKKETLIGFLYLYYYFFNFVKMNKSKVPTTVDKPIVTK